jgi:Fe-S-cluster-containing dehydrogenase component
MSQETLRNAAIKNRFNYCIGCGKCTGTCRISEYVDESFSPRVIIRKLNLEIDVDEKMLEKCNLCEELKVGDITIEAGRAECAKKCKYKINFFAFIKSYRKQAS